MKLRITGNSHCACLHRGAKTIPLFGDVDIAIQGFLFGWQQRDRFHAVTDYGLELKRGARLKKFTADMGGAHIDRDAVWGICMLPHSEYIYTQPRIPADFAEDARHVLAFMADMRDCGIKFFAIMTPGPRRENHEIPPDALPRARVIDREYRKYLRDQFTDMGIDWIEALPEAHDDGGFLRSDYALTEPPDHANAAYGAAMMRNILHRTGG